MQELDEINRNTTPRWSTPKGEHLTDFAVVTTGSNLHFVFTQNKGFFFFKSPKTIENKQMDKLSEEDSFFGEKEESKSAWLEEEEKFTDVKSLGSKLRKNHSRGNHLNFEQKKREDVVNKTIVRSIRRFYLNLFKEENSKLIK